MSEFTPEEEKLLLNFTTNTDKQIFALINLPEVVKGALFSRYSRSTKSLRRVLLEEFILDKQLGFKEIVDCQQTQGIQKIVAMQKAEEFYERILVGFGDDSVAELAGAHIAVENISNIATKFIQDSRIGLSPLEKSTRYVYFDQKQDREYLFYRDPQIMHSEFAEIYESACNSLFGIYAELIPKMSKFFEEKYPRTDDVSERGYISTIRAKTCDVLRGLLPTSTLTNIGLFGNGRAFEYLLTKMYTSELNEIRDIASILHNELRLVLPAFVKRLDNKYGKAHCGYLANTIHATKKIVDQIIKMEEKQENACDCGACGIYECGMRKQEKEELVSIVDYDNDAESKVITAIIYSNSNIPMKKAQALALSLTPEKKESLLAAYIGERENRRHKPSRAFENTYYTFEICSNFGAYRDIHRHRILTQERQLLNTSLGFHIPPEIIQAGFDVEFKDGMEQAENAYEEISKKMPKQAQYVVPFAYCLRWYIKMNLREAYHIAELRSVQQGHSDYRRIAQEIYKKINEVHPMLAKGMKFVDMKNYELERLEAEKKIDKKLDEINF